MSSNRLSQYKKSGLSYQSKKAALKEEMRKETKTKRDEKIMERRRAFLEVKNISNPSESAEIPPKSKSSTQTSRKQRELLKWKEKRDAQKAKEKSEKRPPFVVGRSIRLGEEKNKSSEPCQHKKPSTTVSRPNVVKSKPKNNAGIQKPCSKTQNKSIGMTRPVWNVLESDKSAILPPLEDGNDPLEKEKDKEGNEEGNGENMEDNGGNMEDNGGNKKDNECDMEVNEGNMEDNGGNEKDNECNMEDNGRNMEDNGGNKKYNEVNMEDNEGNMEDNGGDKEDNIRNVDENEVNMEDNGGNMEDNGGNMEDNGGNAKDNGGNAKDNGGNAKDNEVTHENQSDNSTLNDSVDECIVFTNNAWVPDSTVVPTPRVTKDLELFQNKPFSPFVFTASNPDPSSPATEATMRNRSDDSIEQINFSILHNHELTNSDNDRCHSDSQEMDEEAGDNDPVEDYGKKSEFTPFRKLYTDIVDKFTKLCEEWEEKEVQLQEQGIASQEVYDQIRTTVCQARLLMRSKLKQYIGLVDKAEDVNEPLPTKADDLQGFWDMMYIQIADIETQFRNLQVMEDSEWKDGVLEVKKGSATPKQKKKRRRFSRGKKKTPSAKLKADRAKRAEQRKLLKQKIMAVKQQTQGEDPVTTLPNDTVSPNTKSPRTRLSPPPPGSGLTPRLRANNHSSSGTDSPVVGNLISLSPGPSSVKRRKSLRIAVRKSLMAGDTSSSIEDSDSNEGGLVTKLVRIHTSKILQEKLGSDCIMSPARRSLRIKKKSLGPSGLASSSSDENKQLPSNYVYIPNKSITDFSMLPLSSSS